MPHSIDKNNIYGDNKSEKIVFKGSILPFKGIIFSLLADSFSNGKEQDMGKEEKIARLEQQASQHCQTLHEMFGEDPSHFNSSSNTLKKQVDAIVNMNYNDIATFFSRGSQIFDEYGFRKAGIVMKDISNIFSSMRNISNSINIPKEDKDEYIFKISTL